jgi:hypothetical protein
MQILLLAGLRGYYSAELRDHYFLTIIFLLRIAVIKVVCRPKVCSVCVRNKADVDLLIKALKKELSDGK